MFRINTNFKKLSIRYIVLSIMTLWLLNSQSIQGQESSQISIDAIVGNWEGNIVVNEQKTVGILWRFELSDTGKLSGYMGPASKGIATLPMQDITFSESTLKFTIHSEGNYAGTISDKKITGNWHSASGKVLSLNMARKLTKEEISTRFTSNKTKEVSIYEHIQLGDTTAISSFLNTGNDINAISEDGYSLLFYAIKNDRSHKVTTYLLNQGANPNLNCKNISPLMYAVAYQNHTIIKELINHNANINYVSDDKQSALVFAIKGRDTKALQLLLDHGANLTQEIKDGYTAIDLAKKENSREVLEMLNLPYEGISDGPYIQESKKGRVATWIHKGKVFIQEDITKASQTIQYQGAKVTLHENNPVEEEKIAYTNVSKIAAISDIHGQYDTFITLLKNNNIITQDEKWNFGEGHLVVAGDIFDRGPQVTEVLWFLYDLEKQATKNGGKLHVLLGNHDVMVLNGNLRSVHPKYTETATIIGKPFEELFTSETVLGNWLRTRPVVIKINTMLFTHGGLHPDMVTKNISLQHINTEFTNQLIESELPNGRNELGTYLHRENGPIYYRGYFQGETVKEAAIDQLLQYYDAAAIVVGHTTHRHIESRYNGKVIVIDANMKSGEMAEILLWESDTFIRGNLTGEKLQLK